MKNSQAKSSAQKSNSLFELCITAPAARQAIFVLGHKDAGAASRAGGAQALQFIALKLVELGLRGFGFLCHLHLPPSAAFPHFFSSAFSPTLVSFGDSFSGLGFSGLVSFGFSSAGFSGFASLGRPRLSRYLGSTFSSCSREP